MTTKDQQDMNTHTQRYLLTGAAGFIGSNICKKLLSMKETELVVAIDDINDYYSQSIKRRRIRMLSSNNKFRFYEESTLNTEAITSIVNRHKPTTLIHAAAEVGARNGEKNPLKYFATNVMGTVSTLEACKEYIQHAIVFSSSSVYGNGIKGKFKESEQIHLLSRVSTYGASKKAMEIAVQNFFARTGIPTSIIRPFSVYGPDGRPDMLPMKILISAAYNIPIEIYSPSQLSRDWTYIEDFTSMFSCVLKSPDKFQIVNIGSGAPILLKKVISIAEETIRKHGYAFMYYIKNASKTEMVHTWADTGKIQSICPHISLTNFESGFKQTAHAFFSHLDHYTP